MSRFRAVSSTILILAAANLPAVGESIRITVTNHQPAGGFAFTPVWFGLHDGTFDLFEPGMAASAEVEAVAELGNTGPLMTAFEGLGPQSTLLSGGSVPPFLPGDANTLDLDVMDPTTTRYLSFASMVVPSNDLFFGNPNPMAYALFDALGNFNGPLTIEIYGRMVWDAGTEVNAINDGGAFVAGVDATLGTPEDGTVALFFSDPNAEDYLAMINGVMTPVGTISSVFGPDDLIATINVVPEPSALALAGLGLGGLLLVRRKSRRAV